MDRQWWRVLSDSASFAPFVSGFRCIRWFPHLYLGALGGEAIRLARSSQISDYIVLFPLVVLASTSICAAVHFRRVGFFAVRFLCMSSRFKGCIRSRKARFGDGNLQVCFLNDGIVAWRFSLVPLVVRLSGLVVRSCFDSPSPFVLGWVVGICRNRSF
ncbi:unnamed protein product [Brassica oleracea var. botrytis]